MKIKEILTKEDLKNLGIGAFCQVSELEYKEGAIVYVAATPFNRPQEQGCPSQRKYNRLIPVNSSRELTTLGTQRKFLDYKFLEI